MVDLWARDTAEASPEGSLTGATFQNKRETDLSHPSPLQPEPSNASPETNLFPVLRLLSALSMGAASSTVFVAQLGRCGRATGSTVPGGALARRSLPL